MAARKKAKSPFILLFAVFGFLLLAVNGALAFFFLRPDGEPEPESEPEPSPVVAEDLDTIGPILSLDPFVVNLNEPGAPRYLRVRISLELPNEEAKLLVEQRQVPFRDRVIGHLSNLEAARLRSAHDKERLRLELITISEEAFEQSLVNNLYFTEFIIQ